MNPLKFLSRGGASEPTDENFENTVLLLHGDGTNGAQNNTFLDSSTNNFTITRNGNTTQGSFSPFSKPDGAWGNYFDGSGDYLSVPSNAAFTLGTGDFAVECWVYPTAAGTDNGIAGIGGTTTNTPRFFLGYPNVSGRLVLNSYLGDNVVGDTTVPLNQWHHIVFTRQSGIGRIFLNGVLDGYGTYDDNLVGTDLVIGRGYSTLNQTYFAGGYISNFRLIKGSVPSLYQTSSSTKGTTIFTPPTASLTAVSGTSILTCQSNRFKDNSTNNFTITRNGDVKVTPFSPFPITTAYDPAVNGGSGYFDGTGGGGSNTDSLTTPDDNSLDLGSSDFTLEAWIYPTANPTEALRIVEKEGDASNLSYLFLLLSDEKLGFNYSTNGTSYTQTSSSTSISLNTWSHVAITRSGSTFTFWINGVSSGTNTASVTIFNSNAVFRIGNTSSNDRCFPGYISDLRLVKGTAVYTTAFTPPTAPLTAIANTSILCNFTNAGIFDNTGFNNLETVGDSQIDTATKKYGTGSMEFDGTGDYLAARYNADVNLAGGNFTIECWINTDSVSGSRGIVSTANASGGDVAGLVLRINNNKVQFWVNGFNNIISQSTTISTGTWYHVALVRNGSTNTLYVDGVSVGSNSQTPSIGSPSFLVIGRTYSDNNSEYWDGYIDDLRITKGVARYTTTFTPPDKALADIGE